MHDPGELLQRGVMAAMFVDERLERAAAALVTMRISRARSIEADGPLFVLNRSDLLRLHEQENGLLIDETADEPCSRDAVHAGAAPGHPFHGSPPQPCAPPSPRRTSPAAPAARMTRGSGTFRSLMSASSVTAKMTTVGMSISARRPRTYAA